MVGTGTRAYGLAVAYGFDAGGTPYPPYPVDGAATTNAPGATATAKSVDGGPYPAVVRAGKDVND